MNVLFPFGPMRRNLMMAYNRLLRPSIRLPPRLPAAVTAFLRARPVG